MQVKSIILSKKNYFVKQQNIILSKKTNLQKNYKLEGNHLEQLLGVAPTGFLKRRITKLECLILID